MNAAAAADYDRAVARAAHALLQDEDSDSPGPGRYARTLDDLSASFDASGLDRDARGLADRLRAMDDEEMGRALQDYRSPRPDPAPES